jgi:DNA (cytosine-5)-methyltransferase 1
MKRKHAPKVDLLAGGFPCQDLSVAGKREGLKGERSGLFYELLRVAKLCRPEFVLWENVPGLLSSDDGRDFGRVLRGLADIGYFGAWRVLDARFFGVPQRRRRVFGLFARGRFGAVRCAEILALTQSVRGDSAAGQKAGQDVAFTLTSSVGRNSGGTRVGNAWNTNYVAGTLTGGRPKGGYNQRDESGLAVVGTLTAGAHPGSYNGQDAYTGHLIAFSAKDHGADAGDLSPTLRAGGFKDSHQNGGVMPAVCVTGNSTHALTAIGADASEDGTGRGTPVVAFHWNAQADQLPTDHADTANSPPLTCSQGAAAFVPDVAQPIRSNVFNNSDPGMEATMHVAPQGSVRRLTPRECERLMSWPDDWTRWDDVGNEFADGPRYRMCGNGVVSNCAEWIGRRFG